MQIADSKTDEELKKNLHDDDIQGILDAQGAAKWPVLKNKDCIVNIILRHVLVDSTRYLLEDLKKGLETLGVLEAIKKYPDHLRELFTKENISPLDAATVDAIFNIDYDEQGSNGRAIQELAIIHWRDYLQDCESMFQIDHLTRPFRVPTHWMPHVNVYLIHIQIKHFEVLCLKKLPYYIQPFPVFS